ncbi:MAG: GHKL domain-containing protein [Clostridiales bacterium]|nr:GHKL domain-containing protein [Clostridiales bacterium]
MIMGYLGIGMGLLTALLETGFLYIWLKEFVNRRKLNHGIIIAVILFASVVRYYSNEMGNAAFSMALGIACSLIVSIILFSGRYGVLFFYTVVNHAVCISLECLATHFLSDISVVSPLLAFLVEAVLIAAILWTVKKLPVSKVDLNMKSRYSMKQRLIFDSIAIVVCGFAACLYILEDVLDMGVVMSIGFVIANIVLIVSVLAMVHLYGIFGEVLVKARELENINIRLEKLAEYYQNIEDMHEKYDTFIHDIKHQLRAIAALSEDGDCENISSIIAQMRIDVGNIGQGLICSNKVLNALLLERKGYAADNGVALEMEIIEPLNLHNIQDSDLITLIGNLLDNAIDAQKYVNNQNPVLLNMRTARDGRHIVIHLENDYDNKLRLRKTVVKSVEQIGNKHGIGLNSVQNIVRKYGGIIENNKQGGRYVVNAILPIQDEHESTEHQSDSSYVYPHLMLK